MPVSGEAEYKCTLSEELMKKAKKELNEDGKTRAVEVKTLRQRLEKIPGLKAKVDFPFLLSFLRARKFDQERAYELIISHYEKKRDSPDLFEDLKPSRVKHAIDDGILEVLEQRDNEGCRVVVFRPGKWDPERYSNLDIAKLLFLVISKLSEDEETQVSGVHVINNLGDVSMKHASNLTPAFAKKVLGIMQDMVPLRLKRLDYVNEPTFFDVVFAIVKPFMKKKMLKRLHFNGAKPESDLHKSISPDHLPTDLGGKMTMHGNKAFFDDLLTCDAQFEEQNKHGFLNMAVGNSGSDVSASGDASVQGLGGTFKKLDI